ncbi:ParB/RepB/Spo0J family partition protein [Leptolyngbya sp. 7M]|uniref:ParB/RepB/Spo0J family partition protein n=1 Tax=Leptolyngbya sp. 7M TaxID=2812896 RepID=UPI001B8C0455|nr:ParB/RepB/Spo0J family partition protein [Leptolyngbya sp. 7M]QYO67113.1 ParB/RepB/Spo0J family partition protein [Leptolyngbya sp. 7M]
MSKRGLPTGVQMRHDSHYVDILATQSRSIGKTIPIDRLEPNPEQPRRELGDLSELTASIREKGVLEPLLVKPLGDAKYMIIAGERRWRSSKLAGLTEVPCIEMDLDEEEIAEIALIENLQRKDLNVWEEADGLLALQQKFGYTQEQIAQKISKSRSTVTEFLTIAGLPEDIRKRCNENKINSKTTLLEIARQFDDAEMHAHVDRLIGKRSEKSASGRPQVAKESGKSSGAIPTVNEKATFEYSDDGFKVSVIFNDPAHNKRPEILKALKAAFDSVKTGS